MNNITDITTLRGLSSPAAAQALDQMALAMRGMADMMRSTNERMGELEKQVRLLTKVTPLQAGEVCAAIRKRAAELCATYGMTGAEMSVGNAIRRDVRLTQGVSNMRELPRCEYAVVMRQVGMWDDYLVVKAIQKRHNNA